LPAGIGAPLRLEVAVEIGADHEVVVAADGGHHLPVAAAVIRGEDAGFHRLDEVGHRGDMDPQVIDEARENAVRMWHSMGLTKDGGDGRGTVHDQDADTVNALKEELLEAARDAVVGARAESGADPTIVDGVLARLDARGTDG